MTTPRTIAELRVAGYPDRSIKEEMRHNLIERLQGGRALFPRIIGYEDSVIPTFERALLAGHDVILLGERGQAKIRLIRHLVGLLDERSRSSKAARSTTIPIDRSALVAATWSRKRATTRRSLG